LTDADQTFTMGDLSASIDSATGAFRLERLAPGRYYVGMRNLPEGAYIQSVRHGGQDVTRTPADLRFGAGRQILVVLGAKGGEVRALVRDREGAPLPRIQVALWPETPDFGSPFSGVRVTLTDESGAVRFSGLRPEKYRLAAFTDAEAGFVRNPDFLARFRARAAELEVTSGAAFDRTLDPISREDALAVIRNLP
jgi:hypothetical protein